MSKYAQAALDIVKRCQNAKSPDLKSEWDKSMMEIYPNKKPSRTKSCPRNAFLGLCESGMVTGIPEKSYGVRKNNKNKRYTLDAALLVLDGQTDKKAIWRSVCGGEKTHNSQVDIVLSINSVGLLQRPKKHD